MFFKPSIGLEIHIQLATQSKLFSSAANIFGATPNTHTSLTDLGFPGTLPTLNAAALAMAVKFGLSINAEIAHQSTFDRKNYFYPDLPKGYQITQHFCPLIKNGHLIIDDTTTTQPKSIMITAAHSEEDAGKLLHENLAPYSGIDFNRAGVPLLEVITAPEITSAREAVICVKTLQQLVRYLEISSGNMQAGALRCDVNISLRPAEQNELGNKVEIKNLNSLHHIEQAINYEIERQTLILRQHGNVITETRHFDPTCNATFTTREKESAAEYRYFPEPDLLPIIIDAFYIQTIKNSLPELPTATKTRLRAQYNLHDDTINQLCASPTTVKFFEEVVKLTVAPAKMVANWINEKLPEKSSLTATTLAQLLDRINDGTISQTIAKEILPMFCSNKNTLNVDAIITQQNLQQLSDTNELIAIITDIINAYPQEVVKYRRGKIQLFDFFIGQIMRKTNGKANPHLLEQLLKKQLTQQ